MNYLKLNNKLSMPSFGLGTLLSQTHEVGKAVEIALKNGYRLLDCAQVHGNQDQIGEALENVYNTTNIKVFKI